jgi:transposase
MFCSQMKRDPRRYSEAHHKRIAARAEAVALRSVGVSVRRVARITHMHRSTVWRAQQRYKQTKRHSDRKRSGRPSTLTRAVKRKIKTLLHDRNVGSLRKTAQYLGADGVRVSKSTVWNVAKRAKMKNRKPIPKPWSTPAHKAARLHWARARLRDRATAHYKFVFSDEKTFVVSDASARVWLWDDEPVPVRSTRKHAWSQTDSDPCACSAVVPSAIVQNRML